MRRSSPFKQPGASVSSSLNQNSFHDQVSLVLESVERIKALTGETEVLHKNALAQADTEECVKIIAKIEGLVAVVLREATGTRRIISDLVKKEGSPETAKVRSVSKKFLQVMRNFDQVQADYRQRYRNQLERQYRLINPSGSQSDLSLSDLNLAQLSESQSSLLLSQQIFRLSEDSRARRDLEAVKQRNAEMHQLERGVEEVRVLFEEISMLVSQQGEQINRVEDYVVEIGGDVERAAVVLEKSVETHKRSQARRRIVFLLGLSLLIILLLIVFNELFPNVLASIF